MNYVYSDANQLSFSSQPSLKLTHNAFRYPAKFHTPVVKTLIDRYTYKGQTCLDPFCGSGTMLVEAVASGRNAIGLDVDPLAVFVSRVKTTRISPKRLENSCNKFLQILRKRLLEDHKMKSHLITDFQESDYHRRILEEGLKPPPIPNIDHWFRKSVIVQLARIKSTIIDCTRQDEIRDFLMLCFASIIRKCSNADPIPVSGLEVTSYMRKIEENGRLIDVEKEFEKSLRKMIVGSKEFYLRTSITKKVKVEIQDARHLAGTAYVADVVITSPPYQSAVDYYRRHQLEVYWLGLVKNQEERMRLIPNYLGRAGVAKKHLPSRDLPMGAVGADWYERIYARNVRRADDFLHYYWGMREFFNGMFSLLPEGATIVLVVGNNKIHGEELPAAELFHEMSLDKFVLLERFWYPVKNRYMSYKRRNCADINRDFVLSYKKCE